MGLTIFEKSVLDSVKNISCGKLTTYRLLARSIGRPKAVRAVGNALRKNSELVKVPCHRVVRSDGKLGGYLAGVRKKLLLLEKEGIKFERNKIKDLKKYIQQ